MQQSSFGALLNFIFDLMIFDFWLLPKLLKIRLVYGIVLPCLIPIKNR